MHFNPYAETIAETEDPRELEYLTILQITLDLEKFLGATDVSPELKSALWRNQLLWSALRADLLSEGNALPDTLKAGLVSLSFSVDRHTPKVLDGSIDVGLLVDVNRAVMRGLKGVAAEAVHGA